MKQIKDFPELIEVNSNDWLIAQSTNNITYKIKAGALSGQVSSPADKQLNYVSDGDANGAFYWIGTNFTGIGWSNPYNGGGIGLSASSFFSNNYSDSNLSALVDRATFDGFASQNQPNSWLKVDFRNRKLIPNYYSIRARQFNSALIRNWIFQASQNDSDWTTLDTRVDESTSSLKWFSFPISSSVSYRFFRLLQNGVESSGSNFLTLAEIELYGTLQG